MQPAHLTPLQADAAVRLTNDDAALSKLSAVNVGYYADPYIKFFVTNKSFRRDPLMNRGYYSRVAGLQHLLRAFLAAAPEQRKQVVSLGAGFDTTYWRLAEEGIAPHLYIEVDFSEVCNNKSAIIARHKELRDRVSAKWDTDVKVHGGEVHGPHYHLLPADLRNIELLEATLLSAGLDLGLPTIFLSECVLIYLEPEYSSAIIRWAATKFRTSAFITYEQCNPNDSFGAMMIQNLKSRGCSLRGITAFPDIASQRTRYTSSGWQSVEILDMNAVYDAVLSTDEKARVHRLEILDELEEWRIIQSHYFLLWAFRTDDPPNTWKSLGYGKQQRPTGAPVIVPHHPHHK